MAEGITSGVCGAQWSAEGEDSGGVSGSTEHVTKTSSHPTPTTADPGEEEDGGRGGEGLDT